MPRPEITPERPGEVGPVGPDRVTEPLPSTVPTGTPTPEIQPGPSAPEITPGSTPTEIPTVTGRAASADAQAPVHWLAAGWRPDETGLYPRLPEFAAIASPDADRALGELIDRVPAAARVHLVSAHHVDPALVAEMVLAVDRNLQPWHRDGLRAFIDARRLDDRQVIRARYTDRDVGFEQFRTRLGASGAGGSRVS
jgi:hypothetical protein